MGGNPLRILVVHNRYRTAQPSGEDRVVDREMALLAAAGHRVSSFERRSDDIAAMPPHVKATVALRVPWNGAARAELRHRLHADPPDVVHVHNTFPLLSPSVVAACSDTGVPAVATLHNYRLVCPSGTRYRDGRVCTDCTARRPLPAVRHGCYRNSRLATLPLAVGVAAGRRWWASGIARFFCISEAQRGALVLAGFPPERLTVKHNFVPDPPQRRERPGTHLLYLGRLTEEKGLRLLMAAWDGLGTQRPGVPLVLAGTGPLHDEVARWAHGRDDAVCLGIRSEAECSRLLAGATAVVAPSLWQEPFGLVVAEAMAAGVPAVAAGHGAFTELVEHDVTGLLHAPGDAESLASHIRRIAGDIGWNTQLGACARRRYEALFSPETALAALVSGYEAVITGARRSKGWLS